MVQEDMSIPLSAAITDLCCILNQSSCSISLISSVWLCLQCSIWDKNKVRWIMRSAECGKCGVWKMRSVENEECGKWGVWKTRSVENEECGKCGVWKMWSVENWITLYSHWNVLYNIVTHAFKLQKINSIVSSLHFHSKIEQYFLVALKNSKE